MKTLKGGKVMEMNGFMGGFYKLSVLITRFAYTNVIWILFNLPIVYILLSLITSDLSNIQLYLMTIVVLAPFFFFPATTAMFGVVRKWVMGEGDIPIFRSFLKYYRENYVRSLLGGLLFTFLWTSWILNYLMFFQGQSIFFIILFILITAFLFTWTSYFIAYNAHFEVAFFTALKISFILTIGNPFSTIGVVLINGAIIFISSNYTFLIPFFTGSLCAYFAFVYFHKVIQKAMRLFQPNVTEEQQETIEA